MAVSVFGENFCSGLSSVAFIVYLTLLCNKKFTATQYALFSAMSSVGRVSVGPLAAYWVKAWGWVSLYSMACAIGFIPLFILVWLVKRDKVLVRSNRIKHINAGPNIDT
jgi:PAT family beta-lactamase induction signal transducer AmpG